jgi:hypothetical protein
MIAAGIDRRLHVQPFQEEMMSERAISFVEAWLIERIQPDVFHDEEGPAERNKYLAGQLMLDAGSAGIQPHEIEEEYPALISTVADAMEAAADKETKRVILEDE